MTNLAWPNPAGWRSAGWQSKAPGEWTCRWLSSLLRLSCNRQRLSCAREERERHLPCRQVSQQHTQQRRCRAHREDQSGNCNKISTVATVRPGQRAAGPVHSAGSSLGQIWILASDEKTFPPRRQCFAGDCGAPWLGQQFSPSLNLWTSKYFPSEVWRLV